MTEVILNKDRRAHVPTNIRLWAGNSLANTESIGMMHNPKTLRKLPCKSRLGDMRYRMRPTSYCVKVIRFRKPRNTIYRAIHQRQRKTKRFGTVKRPHFLNGGRHVATP